MGKIIERDFFPDLGRLKVQNEYLDAMEKNDVIKMRELHLKYTGKRPPTQRSKCLQTTERSYASQLVENCPRVLATCNKQK